MQRFDRIVRITFKSWCKDTIIISKYKEKRIVFHEVQRKMGLFFVFLDLMSVFYGRPYASLLWECFFKEL